MSYELGFREEALKEWRKLDSGIREQFRRKLIERLEHPRVLTAKLHGHPDRYKIKLRSVGYRLVYEVRDKELIMIVVAVGRLDRGEVYRDAARRK
jgi:mRNA interferase RelE/StbE